MGPNDEIIEKPEEKNEEKPQTFGKFEFRPGGYSVPGCGRKMVDTTTGHPFIAESCYILVPKSGEVNLDDPGTYRPLGEPQSSQNKARTREWLIEQGAVEITPEIEKIRRDKLAFFKQREKELKGMEEEELRIKNKQLKQGRVKVKGVATL